MFSRSSTSLVTGWYRRLIPSLRLLPQVGLDRVALRDLEGGQQHLVHVDFQVAQLGHADRVLDRVLVVGEGLEHLLPALHVELVGVELHPLGVGEFFAGLDAQQDVVGFGVLLAGVVGVVGGNQRDAQLVADPADLLVQHLLPLDPLLLDLQEVAVPEHVPVVPGGLHRLREAAVDDVLGQFAAQAPGEDDDSLVVLVQDLPVQPGAAGALVVPLGEPERRKFDQVLVALEVGRDHRQVVVGPLGPGGPVQAAVGGNVGLHPHQGLDPGRLARQVEGDGAVHHAVVGQRNRRHFEFFGPGEHLFDPAGAVQEGVLGMRMQMYETQAGLASWVHRGSELQPCD